MLKPGGQFFFTAYEKTAIDEVFEKLDEGRWEKYNNRKAHTPFYNFENPCKEYNNLMQRSGFIDCQTFSDHIAPRFSEKDYEGNVQ